jgi:FMN phosphatase YigB (HAD superfamily)
MTLLFIFDMDDVLYDYNWRRRMAGVTAITGFDLAELRRRWWNTDGEWAAEAGVYSTAEEYLEAFSTAMGMPIDEREFVRVRGEAMTVWPESLAAVERAKELGQQRGPHAQARASDCTRACRRFWRALIYVKFLWRQKARSASF